MTNHNPVSTSFKPGQSGNPGGRPKKEWTWAGLLEKVGEETEVKSGQKFKDLVSKRLWIDAINGSLGAQKEIMNRMEGMPKQSTEHSGSIAIPILGGQTNVHTHNSNEAPDETPQEN
jgi:hypothetical protein